MRRRGRYGRRGLRGASPKRVAQRIVSTYSGPNSARPEYSAAKVADLIQRQRAERVKAIISGEYRRRGATETLISLVMDGWSKKAALEHLREMAKLRRDPTLPRDEVGGIISAYIAQQSKIDMGLPEHLADRKSGRRKRRKVVVRDTRWRFW